ncbi:MAG: lytic transglycosylase domain-containing protein [Rubrobacter sp.]|nr:lytic transglycosylase domain-containing protein [Rubrobacter sp.]
MRSMMPGFLSGYGRGYPRRLVLVCVLGLLLLAYGAGPAEAQTGGADIPPEYLDQYQASGAYWGLDWTILAGIGSVESDHGAYGSAEGCILGPPTPYGSAHGPMQFLVSSWGFAGVDGTGNGFVDSCDYRDAIPSAANYLRMHGAPEDYYAAIYAYNRADWYVDAVRAEAQRYDAIYNY